MRALSVPARATPLLCDDPPPQRGSSPDARGAAATARCHGTDLKDATLRALEPFASQLERLDVRLSWAVDPALPLFDVDRGEVDRRLSPLVEDALRRMERATQRDLCIRVETAAERILIGVESNGGPSDPVHPRGPGPVVELEATPIQPPALRSLGDASILVIDPDLGTGIVTRQRVGPDASLCQAERWESGLGLVTRSAVSRVVVGLDTAPPVPLVLASLRSRSVTPLDGIQLVGRKLLSAEARALLDTHDLPFSYKPLVARDLFR